MVSKIIQKVGTVVDLTQLSFVPMCRLSPQVTSEESLGTRV